MKTQLLLFLQTQPVLVKQTQSGRLMGVISHCQTRARTVTSSDTAGRAWGLRTLTRARPCAHHFSLSHQCSSIK